MSRRLSRSMSMNDASGGPRSSGTTQEYQVMAVTKVFAQPDVKKLKQIAQLRAGTVVLGMDTRMDRKGRSYIYHRGAAVPGWSPTHGDDNMPVLLPVVARAVPAEASASADDQASVSTSGAAITAGSYVIVKLKAPFFRQHERDNQVQGLLEVGDVLQVVEIKIDRAGRTKVRHHRGWTPVLAPDRSVALESTDPPALGAKKSSPSAPSVEPMPASAASVQGETKLQETTAVASQPEPARENQRSQSVGLDGFEEVQDHSPKYVPRGRRGSISGRRPGNQQQSSLQNSHSQKPWQKVRSSLGDGRLQSIGDERTVVRLLYVSGEHGFGIEYGVNEQMQPIVGNYLGDSAKHAGVVLGSVITSVDKLAVVSIQQLAQVLQQKEHIARQFPDAAVEFELIPPAVARSDDLLALIGGVSPRPSENLGNIAETKLTPAVTDPHVSELKQVTDQISAVRKVAEKLLRDLPRLQTSLATAETEQAKADLSEEISDTESALKQNHATQGQLLKKQLKIIAVTCEELTEQRNFQIEEAEKFVAFQTKHMMERECAIKDNQDQIHLATAQMEEQTKVLDQKQATLMAEHGESTAPLKAQMEAHLKEVAALDAEIASLLATLKAKQKVRNETMDKADELKGSITAQLKLFAAPALETIEAERQLLAQRKATLRQQQDAVAAEVSAAREGRVAAAETRTQRETKIAAATKELKRLQEMGGRSAMALERLRTDGESRSKIVSAKSSATKVALADAQHAVEALEISKAGEAARRLQSLDEDIPQLEAAVVDLKSRIATLESDKLAFAKAKQFKEAGQAKKDIDTAEEQLDQLKARLAKDRAMSSSTTALSEAKVYTTKLLAAQQAAAAAKSAHRTAVVAAEVEWLGILKGRQAAAQQVADQSAASYIAAQMLVAEYDAQSIAQSFNIDPTIVSAAELEPVPENTAVMKAHQGTYPTIGALSLDAFPHSPLDKHDSVTTMDNAEKHDGMEKVASAAVDPAQIAGDVERGSSGIMREQ